MTILWALVSIFEFRFRSRASLELELVALRHQATVLRRQHRGRPQLSSLDRLLWVWLYRVWPQVIDAMVLVKPTTVIQWHRKGFRLFWRWRSRRSGRPKIGADIRALIRRMSKANPLWGAPRIHGELLKLGIKISQATVGRWMPWRPKVPSPTWRSFLRNHMPDIAAIDMFVVATATFRLLYALIVLSLDRRRIVHFEVTQNPTQVWLSGQMTEAFPWDTAPRYLLRDRDKSYGPAFCHRVRAMGITEVITAPRSPWQNPYVERLIGSIRRECLDHVVILNERHLRRVLSSYFQYHHDSRTHLSLNKDCPRPRRVQLRSSGNIISFPEVGGLHHRYERRGRVRSARRHAPPCPHPIALNLFLSKDNIYHSIVCIGALVAHREPDRWVVDAVGAPYVGERTEKQLIASFCDKIAELSPQLVTFNGNSFDLPVLRYRAMIHGISAPGLSTRPYFQRYTEDGIDLCDALSSFSPQAKATLHEISRVMGLPGKPKGFDGSEVERYFHEGKIKEIADYCETDVVNTYQVWLRYELFRGTLRQSAFEASERNLADFVNARSIVKERLSRMLPENP